MPAPQHGYSGLSSFFSSPAGRALLAMSEPQQQERPQQQPRGGGFDAGGLFASMRPGLRGALADEVGFDQLRQVRNRQPTVFNRGAAGVRGRDDGWIQSPDVEVFDPEHDAPIVAGENARRQGMLNTDSLTALSSIYAPMQAETDQQVRDMEADGDAARFWNHEQPIEQTRNNMAQDLAWGRGGPSMQNAKTAADARVEAAKLTANARTRGPEEVLGTLIANLSRSGAWGRDREGRPMGPPAGVSDTLMRELNGLLNGTDAAGQPPSPTGPGNPRPAPMSGAPAGGGRRISRQQIAAAVNAGEVASIEEGVRQAQAAGLEVY